MTSIVLLTLLATGPSAQPSCGCGSPAPAAPVVTGEVYYETPSAWSFHGFFHKLFHRHHEEEYVSYGPTVITPAPATVAPPRLTPSPEPLPLPKDSKDAPKPEATK